jgi:hypothetical protein
LEAADRLSLSFEFACESANYKGEIQHAAHLCNVYALIAHHCEEAVAIFDT